MTQHIIPLPQMIGQKWFLPLDKLAARSGVTRQTISKVLHGEKIYPAYERKLRAFLENYNGEIE